MIPKVKGIKRFKLKKKAQLLHSFRKEQAESNLPGQLENPSEHPTAEISGSLLGHDLIAYTPLYQDSTPYTYFIMNYFPFKHFPDWPFPH